MHIHGNNITVTPAASEIFRLLGERGDEQNMSLDYFSKSIRRGEMAYTNEQLLHFTCCNKTWCSRCEQSRFPSSGCDIVARFVLRTKCIYFSSVCFFSHPCARWTPPCARESGTTGVRSPRTLDSVVSCGVERYAATLPSICRYPRKCLRLHKYTTCAQQPFL